MSAAASVIYVWAKLQDLAVAIITAIVIIAVAICLWRVYAVRKRNK